MHRIPATVRCHIARFLPSYEIARCLDVSKAYRVIWTDAVINHTDYPNREIAHAVHAHPERSMRELGPEMAWYIVYMWWLCHRNTGRLLTPDAWTECRLEPCMLWSYDRAFFRHIVWRIPLPVMPRIIASLLRTTSVRMIKITPKILAVHTDFSSDPAVQASFGFRAGVHDRPVLTMYSRACGLDAFVDSDVLLATLLHASNGHYLNIVLKNAIRCGIINKKIPPSTMILDRNILIYFERFGIWPKWCRTCREFGML